MATPVILFKNSNGNVNVVLKSTKTVAFINGKFFTQDQILQEELKDCAKVYEFGIYIDPAEPEIDPEFATPMDQLKKKMRDEFLAELEAGKIAGYGKDGGVYSQRPLQESLGNSADTVVGNNLNQGEKDIQDLQRQALQEEGTPASQPSGALADLLKTKTNTPAS